jgi:hypothetical protein
MSARLLEYSSRWEASAIVLSVSSDAFRMLDLHQINPWTWGFRCSEDSGNHDNYKMPASLKHGTGCHA